MNTPFSNTLNTPFSNTFFFLQTGRNCGMHDDIVPCCCGEPSPRPHWSEGASLYALDIAGLQALNDLMNGDEQGFSEWLDRQEEQGTSYGQTQDAAIASAVQQARLEGKFIINYPEYFPWMLPLTGVLRSIVGDGYSDREAYIPETSCECESTHKQTEMVCRACYARLISHIIHTYIYNRRRWEEEQSEHLLPTTNSERPDTRQEARWRPQSRIW